MFHSAKMRKVIKIRLFAGLYFGLTRKGAKVINLRKKNKKGGEYIDLRGAYKVSVDAFSQKSIRGFGRAVSSGGAGIKEKKVRRASEIF